MHARQQGALSCAHSPPPTIDTPWLRRKTPANCWWWCNCLSTLKLAAGWLQVEAEKREIETEEHLKIMADKEIVGVCLAQHGLSAVIPSSAAATACATVDRSTCSNSAFTACSCMTPAAAPCRSRCRNAAKQQHIRHPASVMLNARTRAAR